ncbi:metabotropic glutamate receptor 3-like [Patiria miniata]|uniref:G-protein coupled receptors family 3 profile domain-containing protein n=1 Tax=Patiria miniata TaxID=46514 RepID=A0A914B570_PATMI|nr:metabotropic glutamate receptor 3-like [Patiria miniata]
MQDFEGEKRNFEGEMQDFEGEMRDFEGEMRDFEDEPHYKKWISFSLLCISAVMIALAGILIFNFYEIPAASHVQSGETVPTPKVLSDLEYCQQQLKQFYKDTTSTIPSRPLLPSRTVKIDEFFVNLELSREVAGKIMPGDRVKLSGEQMVFDKVPAVPLDTWEDLFKPEIVEESKIILAVVSEYAQLSYTRRGDINLGGLIPVHFGDCEATPTMWSLQLIEAMVFAIEEINNRSDLLPTISIGFDIRDSCFDEDVGLLSALSLVDRGASLIDQPDESSLCKNNSQDLSKKVVGIVGPLKSSVSIVVGSVADLQKLPMIAFAATSDELSDKERFPYFLRTVPPDRLQATAMVDIITHMGWEYISIIYLADTYGIRGAHALARLAGSRGVCVAHLLPIQQVPSRSELEEISALLWESYKARVLVVFAGPEPATELVNAVENTSNVNDHFIWLGSESWVHSLSRLNKIPPKGALFLSLHNPEPDGFFEYISNLNRDTIQKNPWFESFLSNWEVLHNCTIWFDRQCGLPHLAQYTVTSPMAPVIDAVYAFAHALHSLIYSSNSSTVNGTKLLDALKEVRFDGQRGRFQFNSAGDMEGKYLVQNAQFDSDGFRLVNVGLWDALSMSDDYLTISGDIVWMNGLTEIPTSTCKDVCLPGQRLVPLEEKCCFGCFPCEPYAIVVNNGTECKECEETEWPDKLRLSCLQIIPAFTDWTDPLHLSITILSCMGLAVSMMIAAGLVIYRNHSVIKATSRELSCVNVLGFNLAFVSTFLLIAQPTTIICCVSQAMVSLCFTLAYAPTLLKVGRIYRIFRAGKRSARRPGLISPGVQLIMVFVLVMIQVFCVILSAALGPCEPQYLIPIPRDGHLELYCQLGTGFLISSSYNLVLILACCVFAFLARKVPDNYNESKFIGVSVYSTLLACLAAIAVYYTARDVSQKVAAICLAVLLNAFLTVGCVYIPKLYAIRFINPPSSTVFTIGRAHTSTIESIDNRVGPMSGNWATKTSKIQGDTPGK